MSDSAKTYIIRVEGMHNSFGLGEVISDGVTLFRAGHFNLTKEELESAIKATGRKSK